MRTLRNTPADGRIDVGPLMTHTFPSTEFPAAYANASNYEDDVIKTLVVCECSCCICFRWSLDGFCRVCTFELKVRLQT